MLVRFWVSFPLMEGSVKIGVKLFLRDILYPMMKQFYPDGSVLFQNEKGPTHRVERII